MMNITRVYLFFGMTSFTDLIAGVSLDREGGGFESEDGGPANGADIKRGDGSVSTGDTIIAREGDKVCCMARVGADAGGKTGVCGRRRDCLGDRVPGKSGGGGDSSANLRFLPECGDVDWG